MEKHQRQRYTVKKHEHGISAMNGVLCELSRQIGHPMQSDLHGNGVAEVEDSQPKITGFARHSTQLRQAANPTQAR